jgi:magnesium-dependent phosphatase 1
LAETLASLDQAPKLIVFDLDNTLWTPELYQIRQKQPPIANRDIHLFPAALEFLQYWHSNSSTMQLAIASRTNKRAWAEQLLRDFTVADGVSVGDLMAHVEIYTGSKKKHFAALRDAAGCTYSDMLFFDDDAALNLGEVSSLGVLCCHTPAGLTVPHVCQSLRHFSKLRAGHDAGHWMGYMLNAQNLNLPPAAATTVETTEAVAGRVKFYSEPKKFGFIVNVKSGAEYFVHESKIPAGTKIRTGDSVVFEGGVDGQRRNFAVVLSVGGENKSAGGAAAAKAEDTVEMLAFTMSQPFAALLLNGIKTVETRNNPMFQDVAPGTKVLLHCGRRDWPDQESYRTILQEDGYSGAEIDEASQLPDGFSKGSVIGVLTVGKTWKATDRERKGKDLQRRVLAPYEAVGKACTEIIDADWLERPVKARGNPGVYKTDIPKDCLPK